MLCGGRVELTLAHAGVSIRCLQLWISRFNSMGVDGITCRPFSGQLVSLIVPHNDTEVFQAFLDTMAAEVPVEAGKCVVLVLDNASWHKTKRLVWHHIEPKFLPAYSPDFNPIERTWQHPKGHGMAGYLTRSGVELGEKLFDELRLLLNETDTIRSVSTVKLA
jgi:hypothetical protein